MRPRDTSSSAHDAQVAAARRLGPDGRVRVAVEMSEAVRAIAIDGMLRRRPDLSRAEAGRILLGLSAALPPE